jgi:gag-polypeptide of LTR copia-type
MLGQQGPDCWLPLIQRLPDLTAMEASHLNTAKERWEMVQKEYTAKSKYTQNDLEQAFFEMRCPKGGDVRAFLTNLKTKWNELVAVGMAITDKDYQRTVL